MRYRGMREIRSAPRVERQIKMQGLIQGLEAGGMQGMRD